MQAVAREAQEMVASNQRGIEARRQIIAGRSSKTRREVELGRLEAVLEVWSCDAEAYL